MIVPYDRDHHQFVLVTIPHPLDINSAWRTPVEIAHVTYTRVWIKGSSAHLTERFHDVGVVAAPGARSESTGRHVLYETDDGSGNYLITVPRRWCHFLTINDAERIMEANASITERAAMCDA